MPILTDRLRVSTRGDSHVLDLTADVQSQLQRHAFREGFVLVFVPGSTAGLTTIEYEPGLIEDVPAALDRLAPEDADYKHQETWRDGNGHSHVKAALIGPSVTVPFRDGRLLLGTWQQIVLIDFDNRPRQRDLVVQFHGERDA